MTAELRIGLRHWLAAVAAAALVHALVIAALEASGARGWLGTNAARRPAAAGRGLRVAVSLESFQPLASHQAPQPLAPPASGRRQPTGTPTAAERATATLRSPQPELRAPAPLREEPTRSARDSPQPSRPATSDALEPDRVAAVSKLGGSLSNDLSRAVPDDLSGDFPHGLRGGEPAAGSALTRSGDAIEAGGSQTIDYFTALYERVQAVHDYPRRAHREQIEGTVLLSIRIDREGRVASCRVRESSGASVLDRHAVRTVHRAAPFGAVPTSTDDSELDFDLPLEYRLR